MESRASSMDPLLLFTPSKPSLSPSPPLEIPLVGAQLSMSPFSPTQQLLSPLTPVQSIASSPSRSPSKILRRVPQNGLPSPLRTSRKLSDQGGTESSYHGDDNTIIQALLPEDHENDSGRYALRARNRRQLNPYAFDKASYQRQLKNIPEAIVHLSPRRRRRESSVHSSPDQAPSSDPEVDPTTLQMEDSEDEKLRRRRRSKSNDVGHQTVAIVGSGKPSQYEYPEFLQFPSSSEESGIEDLLEPQSAKSSDARPTRRPKRRRRPFPMSEKALGKRPAEPELEPKVSCSLPSCSLSVRRIYSSRMLLVDVRFRGGSHWIVQMTRMSSPPRQRSLHNKTILGRLLFGA